MSLVSEEIQHVSLTDKIKNLASEVFIDDSYFVVDIQMRGYKGSRVVEMYIDSDSGINVDQIASISRRLGFLMETEGTIEGKYTLTISSPGDKYDFKLPRQYRKHVGHKLDIKVSPKGEGEKPESVQGTLETVSTESVLLVLENKEKREVVFESISSTKVVLPW